MVFKLLVVLVSYAVFSEICAQNVIIQFSNLPPPEENVQFVQNSESGFQSEVLKWTDSLFKDHVKLTVLLEPDPQNKQYLLHLGNIRDVVDLSPFAITFLICLLLIPILLMIILSYKYFTSANVAASRCYTCLFVTLVLIFLVTLIGIVFAFLVNKETEESVSKVDNNLNGNINSTISYFDNTEQQMKHLFKRNFDEYYNAQRKLYNQYKNISDEYSQFSPLLQNNDDLIETLNNITILTTKTCDASKTIENLVQSIKELNRLKNKFITINNPEVNETISTYNTTIKEENISSLTDLCVKLTKIPAKIVAKNFMTHLQRVNKTLQEKTNESTTIIANLDLDLQNRKIKTLNIGGVLTAKLQNQKNSIKSTVTKQEKLDIETLQKLVNNFTIYLITMTIVFVLAACGIITGLLIINKKPKMAKYCVCIGFILLLILDVILIICIIKSFTVWYLTKNSICDDKLKTEPNELLTILDTIYGFENQTQLMFDNCRFNKTYYNVFMRMQPSDFIVDQKMAIISKTNSYTDLQLLDAQAITQFQNLQENLTVIEKQTPINQLNQSKQELHSIPYVLENQIPSLIKYLQDMEIKFRNTDTEIEISNLVTSLQKIIMRYTPLIKQSKKLISDLNTIDSLNFKSYKANLEKVVTKVQAKQDDENKNFAAKLDRKSTSYSTSANDLNQQYNNRVMHYLSNEIGRCDKLFPVYESSISNCDIILSPLNSFWVVLLMVLLSQLIFAIFTRLSYVFQNKTPERIQSLEEHPLNHLYEVPDRVSFDNDLRAPMKERPRDEVDNESLTPPTPETPLNFDTRSMDLLSSTGWVFEERHDKSEKPPPYSEYESPHQRYSMYSGTFKRAHPKLRLEQYSENEE